MGRNLEYRIVRLERVAAERAQHDPDRDAVLDLFDRLDQIRDRLLSAPMGPPPADEMSFMERIALMDDRDRAAAISERVGAPPGTA